MRKKLVAGNWKMNFSVREVKTYISKFPRLLKSGVEERVILFGQALYLHELQEELGKTKIKVGAQNCFCQLEGAFTGENSPQTIALMGISHVLVGHSERRQIFKETNDDVMLKVKVLQKLNLTPMICVGETFDQRKDGQTEKIIVEQLDRALVEADLSKPIHVAYEPVWAIGSGKVATPEQAQLAHKFLREFLARKRIENSHILYGGSVKAENVPSLLACPDIDGFLVGGASLIPETFAQICNLTLATT